MSLRTKPLVKVFTRTKTNIPLAGFAVNADPAVEFEVCEASEYSPCDVAILYGCAKANDEGASPGRSLKNSIHQRHHGPKIIVETGFIGRINTQRRRFPRLRALLGRPGAAFVAGHTFYRVGLNGAFGDDADFANLGSPPDRWLEQAKACNITLQPYRRTGRHILLVGQIPGDASLRGVSVGDWAIECAKRIRTLSDRPIRFRAHPNMDLKRMAELRKQLRSVPDVTMDPPTGRSLALDLADCWACVTHSSSSSVDALIAGVPPICLSPANIAYRLCSKSLDDVEAPSEPEREQWFYDLAYAQWTEAEIGAGRAWHHLRASVLAKL